MSTFVNSPLKIELIGTGEQVGTWGATTNDNWEAVQEAITGSADVTFSSADVTLTLTDSNASQTARNLRLVCTGTSGGARQLILGSGCQIDRLYLIQNDLADTLTVKNTTGTGVAVASGDKKFVFNNGVNVVEAIDVGLQVVDLASDVTGTLPIANGGTGSTSTTFCSLTTNVTGTLPAANGGTGQSSYSNGQLLIGNGTTGGLSKSTLSAGSGVSISNTAGGITISATGSGGSVTSVGMTAPTGFSVSGSPVTTSGTLALSFASGYSLPTNSSQTDWNTAFSDRLKWDGGSTGLNASTGRTSLGLGSLATLSTVGTSQITNAAVTPAKLSGGQSGSAPVYGARAWVNFNGTGTVAIRASGNVSSVTDLGAGQYRPNFSTAMSDTNYAVTAAAGTDINAFGYAGAFATSTSSCQVAHFFPGTGFIDVAQIYAVVVR